MNTSTHSYAEEVLKNPDRYRVSVHNISGVSVIDCGCNVLGGLTIGKLLARMTMGMLGEVNLRAGTTNSFGMPLIEVETDSPTRACLGSQYAGWPMNHDGYFAMVSGPIRLHRQREELLKQLQLVDSSNMTVGILESSLLPSSTVIDHIAESIKVARDRIVLLVAPTTSLAGMIQVVSRSIETCLHKLTHLGFDTTCIISAVGTAPLPPIVPDVMQAIGRSNDAILYGSEVILYMDTNDEAILSIGDKLPSSASSMYGKPFVEILKEAGDFYSIDPMLFSAAVITINNLRSGLSVRYGKTTPERLTEFVSQL